MRLYRRSIPCIKSNGGDDHSRSILEIRTSVALRSIGGASGATGGKVWTYYESTFSAYTSYLYHYYTIFITLCEYTQG